MPCTTRYTLTNSRERMAGRGERATLAKDDNGSGASSSFLEGEEIREGGGRLGRSSTFERED